MTTPDTTSGDNQLQLPDRYALIKGLGAGGMSQVFLATDTTLLKDVAIKVLHSSGQSDPQQLIRFQREAKITGQLKHRNIVGINDFGMTSSGQAYIVMDHIAGESLSDILDRIGAIELNDATPLMLEILDAVEFAHAHGVMHRDLKPSNVIISQTENEFDVVKLIDFGLAKLADPDQSLTGSGSVFGSPAYMSPEQARGKHIDARSEVYSLGCLFFSVLTGEPPFEAETAFEVLNLHCNAQPPLLHDVQPEIKFSEEIQDLISKCIEKDPEMRFQSVAELSRQLRLLDDAARTQRETDEEGATARSVFHLAERSDKRTRHHAMQRTMSVFVVFALIALVVTVVNLIFNQASTIDPEIAPGAEKDIDELKRTIEKFKITPEAGIEICLSATIPGLMTDEDLKDIGNRKYTKLKLRDEPINGSGLKYVHNPTLLHLDVSNVRLSKEGWEAISNLKTLECIDLEGIPFHNAHVRYLIPLSKVETINFTQSPGLDAEGYKMLTKMPSLRVATIMDSKLPNRAIPKGAVAELAKKENFSSINFLNCLITPEDLRPLRNKANSFGLTFENIELNKPLLEEISKLTLWQLALSKTNVTAQSLMALKKLKSEHITLMNCTGGITKSDRDAYRKLISPRKVNFHIIEKEVTVDEKG